MTLDPTTARAEQLRERTGISWEAACAIAERERDACTAAAPCENIVRCVTCAEYLTPVTRRHARLDNLDAQLAFGLGTTLAIVGLIAGELAAVVLGLVMFT